MWSWLDEPTHDRLEHVGALLGADSAQSFLFGFDLLAPQRRDLRLLGRKHGDPAELFYGRRSNRLPPSREHYRLDLLRNRLGRWSAPLRRRIRHLRVTCRARFAPNWRSDGLDHPLDPSPVLQPFRVRGSSVS